MDAMAVLAAVGGDGFRVGLVATTFAYGLRHGIDWDHIAAISDITGSQDSARQSMKFATLYALGHGAVVFVLGVLAIVFAERLPSAVDGAMERVVGVTLLALGLYVIQGLVRHGRDFRMRSRWMVVFAGARTLARRLRRAEPVVIDHDHDHDDAHHLERAAADAVPAHAGPGALPGGSLHRHRHRHVAPMPDDPFANYGRATSFGVGMIHGIGAETPTQVLIFLAAAGAGGKGTGVLLLVCFLTGLITSNTAIAAASTFGFLSATGNFRIYAAVSIVVAAFSLGLGALFVLGGGGLLPAIFSR